MPAILSTHLRCLSAAILCSAFLSPPAKAAGDAPFCVAIHALVTAARSNFAGGAADLATPGMAPAPPGTARCFMARSLSGANAYHCAWRFDYRDSAANTAFGALNRGLAGCLGGGGVRDQDVNHPDFHDQRRYSRDGVTVTVSLKDKGALRETHVFIGVQGVASD